MLAGVRAGDAFGDDRLDGVGNAGLQRAAAGTVQRRLDPDLAHGASSAGFVTLWHIAVVCPTGPRGSRPWRIATLRRVGAPRKARTIGVVKHKARKSSN